MTKSLMTVRREKPPLHLVCTEGLCGIIAKVFYSLSNVLELRLLVKMPHCIYITRNLVFVEMKIDDYEYRAL